MIDWGKIFLIGAAALAAALLTTVIVLLFQLSSVKVSLKETEDFYRQELEENRVLLDELSQNMQILASGNNEVRRYMNLPERELIRKETPSEESSVDPTISFFDAFRYLANQERLENNAAVFSQWLEDSSLESFFVSKNYSFKRNDYETASVIKNGTEVLTLRYTSQDSSVEVIDISGEESSISIEDTSTDELLNDHYEKLETYDRLVQNAAALINSTVSDSDLRKILRERELSFESSGQNSVSIINAKDHSVIGSFGHAGPDFKINDTVYQSEVPFREALIEFLNTVNTETESERIDAIVLEKMKEVFADEGFKVLLESENCKAEPRIEEDEEFIYFHIDRNDGTIKGTYALQKNFGEVLLISGDGKYLKSLNMFTPGNDFRSLIIKAEEEKALSSPYAFDDSSDTFLVVGTHEHNADTMIIVNADNKSGKIRMISFPRDLYYKGNKINNIYKEYGPEQLCVELSEITGLSIKKYISIDMFAFIDVINILGGIDVTLESDLIDPTYKVKNNGVWSTLYYRKGTHHLDGVAALRVARSRHGSEAYDRSRRQQLIIKALMDKLVSLNAGDLSTMYDFVTSVFSYIDTNLSIADLVKNFAMYKDNDVEDPNTINTDNVLTAEWTNTYLLPEAEKEIALADSNFFKGQWIVLPKNNNWDLIKKHIEKILFNGN